MSFTEFTYQLIQGYDFYYLWKHYGVKLQMGGSDQWGNIVTGSELIRRKDGGEAYAITTPLIKKADGTKFGKSETGNIFLDRKKTSPYKFYQFWLNSADADAVNYIKIFCFFSKEETESLIEKHNQAPHERLLQTTLAKDLTIRVHSLEDYNSAVEASQILFGNSTTEALQKMTEQSLLEIFEGVPQFNISKSSLESGINIIQFLADSTAVFTSKGEARKMLTSGGVSLNKAKVTDVEKQITTSDLIQNRYVIVQKGKKNYFLVKVE